MPLVFFFLFVSVFFVLATAIASVFIRCSVCNKLTLESPSNPSVCCWCEINSILSRRKNEFANSPIETLYHKLASCPELTVSIDRPEGEGTWSVDAKFNDKWAVVEWDRKHGFGITANREVGERPDERCWDLVEATTVVKAALFHGLKTRPNATTPQ